MDNQVAYNPNKEVYESLTEAIKTGNFTSTKMCETAKKKLAIVLALDSLKQKNDNFRTWLATCRNDEGFESSMQQSFLNEYNDFYKMFLNVV